MQTEEQKRGRPGNEARGLAHPNLYEFIEIIQREQAATEAILQQLGEGGRLWAKRRKVVQHEENIKRLTNDVTA